MVGSQATRPPVEGHGPTKERSVPAPAGSDGGRRAAAAPRTGDTGFQSGGGGATAAPQEAPQVGTPCLTQSCHLCDGQCCILCR